MIKLRLLVFVTFVFLCVLTIIACQKESQVLTPVMESQARKTIEVYLQKQQLPLEDLRPLSSMSSQKADFGYLYTGNGRCIEFVVKCYKDNCTDWEKYPYDEHGDQCP